jgi:hypothetical protein
MVISEPTSHDIEQAQNEEFATYEDFITETRNPPQLDVNERLMQRRFASISLKNITMERLWDRWLRGYKDAANPSLSQAPWRYLHDSDFEGQAFRKAKVVMGLVLREAHDLKVLKRRQRITDLSSEEERQLRNQAIANAREKATRIRRTVGAKEQQPRGPVISQTFQTFYEYVAVDKLLEKYRKKNNFDCSDSGL